MNKILWAPWRLTFIAKAHKKTKGCIFCDLPKKGCNPQNLILYQNQVAFVILNRYPYNSGHLMVVPKRHLASFEKLSIKEHQELGVLLQRSLKALKKVSRPQGFNIGLNLEKVAGAGIKDHLHYHLVPRWMGDNNFMPVLGAIRTIPEHLLATYKKLKKWF